jgi:hypothetical protein
MKFVFLHVGKDANTQLFVDSIRFSNPGAHITQCSDYQTNRLNGVTEIFRIDSDVSNLMTFRLKCFSKLRLTEPAIYLDTDMLVLRRVVPMEILKSSQVACCERSFGRDDLINTTFRGMDLTEYKDRTLGEIYPIIACFTVTENFSFWATCLDELLRLDEKFHWWYGDQEAMRNITKSGKFRTIYIPEDEIACLPEYVKDNELPVCIHFKGAKRKALMMEVWKSIQAGHQ